jgi:hypothetical protein
MSVTQKSIAEVNAFLPMDGARQGVHSAGPILRTVGEAVAMLRQLPGERGVMDEEFARDVRQFREVQAESIDSSRWG